MDIKEISVDQLIPYEFNNKIHDATQVNRIANSIKEFGFLQPIVIDKNNIVVVGHGRLEGAKKLGLKTVPCLMAENLTDEQIKKYRILDNKLNESERDMENLKLELEELPDLNFGDLELEIDDLFGDLFPEETEEKEVEEDEVPKVSAEAKVVREGDLFILGKHRLLCGDSTKEEDVAKLMDGVKADMVFTDPPFPNNSEIMHEMIVDIDKAFYNARLFCDGLQMWFWDNLSFPPFEEMVTSKHIWHKTNGRQANHYEEIYCFHNDGKRHEQLVFSNCNVGTEMNREELGNHPTPKPISLFCDIYNELKINKNSVLDLFGGSGSTLIACEQLNRKCYMMELDPKYCEVIIKRFHKINPDAEIKCTNREININEILSDKK